VARTGAESTLTFTCNICGRGSTVPRSELTREAASCNGCGSSVRFRAIVHILSTALFGRSVPLIDFPVRPDLAGAGLSDWIGYAGVLAARLGYRNTFYHEEPRLDIAERPPELRGTLDFLVASDVFEHVVPPVERAFLGSFELLRPGGVLLLTTPYAPDGETIEHFPELHEHEVVDFHGRKVLLNRTADGRWQVFGELAFHGGEGETLEMRVFSRAALVRHLRAAGFEEIVECSDDYEPYGVVWLVPWSQPFLARRG